MVQRRPWRGETVEQLVESLGRPAEVDQKVLESRLQETWNYDRIARDRYKLSVTIENGRVIGWEAKKRVSAISFKAVRSHLSRATVGWASRPPFPASRRKHSNKN